MQPLRLPKRFGALILLLAAGAFLVVPLVLVASTRSTGGQQASQAKVVMFLAEEDVMSPEDAGRTGFQITRTPGDFALSIGDETVAVVVTKASIEALPSDVLLDAYNKGIFVGGLDLTREELHRVLRQPPPDTPSVDWVNQFGYPHQLVIAGQQVCDDGHRQGSSGVIPVPKNDLAQNLEIYLKVHSCK
jgi:hypothetical protein